MAQKYYPPREVDGWVCSERPRKVNRSNIFDYMDGAGELYLAYSFVSLDVWQYKKAGQPNILLEIYEMEDSSDAFGVLSFDLRGEEVGIGRKSVYGAGLLRFWKGKYFVRTLAEAETPAAREAVLKIGKGLAANLRGKASLPKLVGKLPQPGLEPESIHYFHKKMCLDYLYYLAEDNILSLDEITKAVMADYEMPSGAAKLLVVEYPSEGASKKAWERFHAAYLEQPAPKPGAVSSTKIEGEVWVCSQREGKLLIIVFEGKNQTDCEELLRRATDKMTKGG